MQDTSTDTAILELESKYKNLSKDQLAQEAIRIATQQIISCTEFKKPRITRLNKYWRLYDGKVEKKLRQLFNVPIPVFAGMVDTLNAQYDTPITLQFREGDAADYFKVQKINAAWEMEVLNTNQNSKWDSKLRMARKQAIMNGRSILEYTATSDPEYKSKLTVVGLDRFNFQPRGGLWLENHYYAGTEDIEKTRADLIKGAQSGIYDKEQVKKLLANTEDREYSPSESVSDPTKLERFQALGLDAESDTYVGQAVFKLASHILELDGTRYYLLFHPWTQTWLRFEKWKDIDRSELYPWVSYATHEDEENFLSKGYADDLYPAADAIVAMFNQELTNREKRNFGARAYDKDMFTDVRKLDEAMHRPDALVPADTKNGSRRISEGIYEFKVAELGGTVNLIDWISGSLGRNTGANELSQGSVSEVSKKASVTFAEQKAVSKRIGWAAQPFQDMMGELGVRYKNGLIEHMPAKMAVRQLGVSGWDWDEITRMDLDLEKDVDVLIISSDQQMQESELKAKRRIEAINLLINSPNINGQKRDEEILRSIGEYDDEEIAEFLDVKTYSDKKSLAKAAESIQLILRNQKPELWYGANIAFIQKIVDFAADKRMTLEGKFEKLMEYALAHREIARENIERDISEDTRVSDAQVDAAPGGGLPLPESDSENPGVSGGMSRAMSVGEQAI